jgi:enoyl-CoA hydratase/carnithine racemase
VLLSGRVLLAEELAAFGFFNAVYERDCFTHEVYAYARKPAALSPGATAATKRQLYDDLLHTDPARSVRESKNLIGQLMQEPDYREGVAALIEKRSPRFAR